LELLHNGLKVIISTHSTTLLDFAWAFNAIKKASSDRKEDALFKLFNIRKTQASRQLFDGLFDKTLSTYYFSRVANGKVESTDISTLDAGSENDAISGWGGLSKFSADAADIVYEYAE